MITELKRFIVSKNRYVSTFIGNEDDIKPTGKINGSRFIDIDNGIEYLYDEENNIWHEQPSGGGGEGYEPNPNKGIRIESNKLVIKVDGETITFDSNGRLTATVGSKIKHTEDDIEVEGFTLPTISNEVLTEIYNTIMTEGRMVYLESPDSNERYAIVNAKNDGTNTFIYLVCGKDCLVEYKSTSGTDADISVAKLGGGQIIDVGSNQFVYDSYSLPAIDKEDLVEIYNNHKAPKLQVIKWTLLGSETYLKCVSADYIAGNFSIDVLVHNKYHCQYTWNNSTTGLVNPEVKVIDWNDIINKPFETLGEGVSKNSDDELVSNFITGVYGKPKALNGVDLNTITNTGVYSCDVCTNRPNNSNGVMLVLKNAGTSDNAVQIYSTFQNDKTYIRHKDLGVWKEWKSITSENVKTEVDAATITETGFYRLEDCSGLPNGYGRGELIVVRANDSGSSLMQICTFIDENEQEIYFRGARYSEFYEWQQISSNTAQLHLDSPSDESLSGEAETQAEVNEENASAIKTLEARALVADIVQCYDRGTDTTKTDIVHYDISTLNVGNSVMVIIDETHNDCSSYYKVKETAGVKSFEYQGSDKPAGVDDITIDRDANGKLQVKMSRRSIWDEAYSNRVRNNTETNFTTREQLLGNCINGTNAHLTKFSTASENPDGVVSSQLWNIITYKVDNSSCRMLAYLAGTDKIYSCYRKNSGWEAWELMGSGAQHITLSSETGTLTSAQLSLLLANDNNYIVFDDGEGTVSFRLSRTGGGARLYSTMLSESAGTEDDQSVVGVLSFLVNSSTGAYSMVRYTASPNGYKDYMTGEIASGNTGFVKGGDAYNELIKKVNIADCNLFEYEYTNGTTSLEMTVRGE